ncbi:hypothetical protein [Frankia sp. QA3]|uniref:hypothetical protein n=1 Tax=Frankia sp. QA3 TaxID=710111 RepID=UPI000269BAC8|nr:hypothetical protein [Frankia sp. QA3]EIV91008.1 hypothetical protein FraQA3DRAFT_0425 [Frankia sp. QA3]
MHQCRQPLADRAELALDLDDDVQIRWRVDPALPAATRTAVETLRGPVGDRAGVRAAAAVAVDQSESR